VSRANVWEQQGMQALEAQMLATADQQISLTDPDARSMVTSDRGSGVVGMVSQAMARMCDLP
jgi:hypothetical protein